MRVSISYRAAVMLKELRCNISVRSCSAFASRFLTASSPESPGVLPRLLSPGAIHISVPNVSFLSAFLRHFYLKSHKKAASSAIAKSSSLLRTAFIPYSPLQLSPITSYRNANENRCVRKNIHGGYSIASIRQAKASCRGAQHRVVPASLFLLATSPFFL